MTTATPLILQELDEPAARRRGIRLILLRDDLTHPELPGNKWRKLKYNLLEARAQGHDTLLTFGGLFLIIWPPWPPLVGSMGFALSGWCAAKKAVL
ncbi:hypothetical protein [Hymenobacter radiodurans]|uniref:hypothetical protein n=1 Tax=Hymenobacter radiodurans TaxID=2496028 RepID=UPI001F0D7652|nr:hypothetical protein [Hymenobacter radiodurans]